MAAGLPNKLSQIPAETRVFCVHAFECAGCPLIDSTYGEQLGIKARRVQAAFDSFGAHAAIAPVAPAEAIVGYRSRAKLMVSSDGKIGLFAKGGDHRIVDIPQCRVLAPSLARATAVLRDVLANHSALPAMRAVDLREVQSNGEARALATLVVDRATSPAIETLRVLAQEIIRVDPFFAGIAVNFRKEGAPQILGDQTTLLAGVSEASDTHGRSTHLATFGAFVQAHRGQAARIHDEVISAFGLARGPKRVLDLYGGAGAIALALAAHGADVEVVESFGPAAERARRAGKSQNVRLHATTSDTAYALRDLLQKKRHFDAVVANPPRRGMSPEARERLAELTPGLIAYVSCDPETLARDLDHLSRLGYEAQRLQPIDMIPLTEEVETVAVLHRADPPAPTVLFEDEQIIAVAKAAHEPIAALQKRLRRVAGAENATAVSSLDPATSGAALFVRRSELLDSWTNALRAASTALTFLLVCRGIAREKGVISRGSKKQSRVVSTRYRRLAIVGGHSLVRAIATHVALRESADFGVSKHLAEIGHPPVGDSRLGDVRTNRFFEEKHALDRPFVHALRLEIDRPVTGERLVVEAPLAADLRMTLGRLTTKEILDRLEQKNAFGGAPAIPDPAVAAREG